VSERVRPEYAGGSIVNLVASIAAHFGVDTGHAPLTSRPPLDGHDAVVLLIVDALGHRQLEQHLADGDMPFLAARLAGREATLGPATSVFPPTTAAALSSFHIGKPPASHGMLGYTIWLPERGAVGEMIRFWDLVADRPLPDPAELTLGEPLYRRLAAAGATCRVVSASAYRGSAFSRWLFGDTPMVGYASANTLPAQIAAALAGSGRRYVVAYWPGYDLVCHAQGPTGREAGDEAAAVDHCLARMVAALRGQPALLLVAADHGQTALAPEHAVDLRALIGDLLLSPPGGERRGR
jgi:predicted AlkP superfamily pyrophosphatase or phosphodiesterase